MVSMSSVMAIEQCRILAGWFSGMSYEVENQPLMLSGVALQTRINLLHIALRDPEVQALLAARYPRCEAMTRLDVAAFDAAMRNPAARSLTFGRPFARARAFLSAPEMRDPGLVQAYLEDVAADPTAAYDATGFLRLDGHLRSPMLDILRDVVDGCDRRSSTQPVPQNGSCCWSRARPGKGDSRAASPGTPAHGHDTQCFNGLREGLR